MFHLHQSLIFGLASCHLGLYRHDFGKITSMIFLDRVDRQSWSGCSSLKHGASSGTFDLDVIDADVCLFIHLENLVRK